MSAVTIGLLNKKRGNFRIQEKFAGAAKVVDETSAEVAHHEKALRDAGYEVRVINWGPDIIRDLAEANVDLVFNVSSLVEAAILEELEMPFVGSDSFTIALATDKSLAKRLWDRAGLPTRVHPSKLESNVLIVVATATPCHASNATDSANIWIAFMEPSLSNKCVSLSGCQLAASQSHILAVPRVSYQPRTSADPISERRGLCPWSLRIVPQHLQADVSHLPKLKRSFYRNGLRGSIGNVAASDNTDGLALNHAPLPAPSWKSYT